MISASAVCLTGIANYEYSITFNAVGMNPAVNTLII